MEEEEKDLQVGEIVTIDGCIIEGAHFDYDSATFDAINEYLNKEVL